MDYNMGVLLVAVISILLVLRSWAAPLDSNNMEDDSSTIDGYLVDDMYLSILRNGIIDPAKTWPNGTVYYKISSDFGKNCIRSKLIKLISIIQRLLEYQNFKRTFSASI